MRKLDYGSHARPSYLHPMFLLLVQSLQQSGPDPVYPVSKLFFFIEKSSFQAGKDENDPSRCLTAGGFFLAAEPFPPIC